MSNEEEQQQLEQMVSEMFDEYMDGGFDFTTSQTLEDIFRQIFIDAVTMTVEIYENEEEAV